jgi:type IV secretory pathway VirB10-like protein
MRILLGWCLTLLSSALVGGAVYQVVLSEPHGQTITGATSGTRPSGPEPTPTPTITRTVVRTVVDPAPTITVVDVISRVESAAQRTTTQAPRPTRAPKARTTRAPTPHTTRESHPQDSRTPAPERTSRDDDDTDRSEAAKHAAEREQEAAKQAAEREREAAKQAAEREQEAAERAEEDREDGED